MGSEIPPESAAPTLAFSTRRATHFKGSEKAVFGSGLLAAGKIERIGKGASGSKFRYFKV